MWKMVLWLRRVGDGGIDACLRAWVEKGRTWDSCSRGVIGEFVGGLIFLFLSIFFISLILSISFSLNTVWRFNPGLKHGHKFAGCMEILNRGVFSFRFITGFPRPLGKSLRRRLPWSKGVLRGGTPFHG